VWMSKTRSWCFVLHANDQDELDEVPIAWNPDYMEYLVYQMERAPTTGRRHFQGFLYTKNPVAMTTLKNKFGSRINWQPKVANSTNAQAAEYCKKAETRLMPPQEFGVLPSQGTRSDLLAIQQMLDQGAGMLEVARANFGSFLRYNRGYTAYAAMVSTGSTRRTWMTEAIVYWGPPGSGKSQHVMELAPEAFWLSRPNNPTCFFDGYQGQEDVVIDDFYGWLPRDFLLRLIDRYPFQVATRSGAVNFVAKRVFFTSNADPAQWYRNVGLGGLERRLPHIFHVDYSFEFPCVACTTFPHQEGCRYVASLALPNAPDALPNPHGFDIVPHGHPDY